MALLTSPLQEAAEVTSCVFRVWLSKADTLAGERSQKVFGLRLAMKALFPDQQAAPIGPQGQTCCGDGPGLGLPLCGRLLTPGCVSVQPVPAGGGRVPNSVTSLLPGDLVQSMAASR